MRAAGCGSGLGHSPAHLGPASGHSTDRGVARHIERFSPNTITAVLVAVAGLTFLLKAGGGLYWLIPAAVTSLLGGVVNAWLFLVKVTS